ncbi:MAG: DUF4238 domain-containing protein [Gammaproteobacteria bacterium]|nr:DUF4238 domain-containing protein [Gammaproteobacteria bacterium]
MAKIISWKCLYSCSTFGDEIPNYVVSVSIDRDIADKMSETRNNHYVPEWYQKGFLLPSRGQLHYLDLSPDKKELSDGRVITYRASNHWPVSKCFRERDLYTTFFGPYINDEIERELFGKVDDVGSKAVRAFIGGDFSECHKRFQDFFSYIDTQKIRTPKGLAWISKHYPQLSQLQLMIEMQSLRNMHCTIWTEGVREIVSAEKSSLKFIISDHPVTIYNYACPPESQECIYPDDPPIAFKGSQTIFPLDRDHCLILTNLEYAENADANPLENRTNARNFGNSLVRTDAFIRSRFLSEEEVRKLNFIVKKRARRYIAAPERDWLYPEKDIQSDWSALRKTFLPPKGEMFHFGGEIYVGHKDGSTYYQDAFGRTTGDVPYLKKKKKEEPGPNDSCVCGSGKKYKKCCRDKDPSQRPASDVLSIRERNLIFCRKVKDTLGLYDGKTWDDVRKELDEDKVKDIYEFFGGLWPVDTDVVSLLPKPDGTLRALYTGLIDPRTISHFAMNGVLYFDEILIQSPFINPATVKAEYSPVHNPDQYKQQTLKNVFLLFMLEPFIDAGLVNFIPDPCSFNGYLRMQMFDMAEERAGNKKMLKTEMARLKELGKDDFKRLQFMLPKEVMKAQIQKALPDLSEDQVVELIDYMESEKQRDPLSLLQDGLYGDGKGQLMIMSMSPNFEMSLFIAQATGSLIFTDSPYRWDELQSSQYLENGNPKYQWRDLTEFMNRQDYFLNSNPETIFRLRVSGKLGRLRKVLGDIYTAIKSESDPNIIGSLTEHFTQQFTKAREISYRELINPKGLNGEIIPGMEQHSFKGKFIYLSPMSGIIHNNVQRLLFSCGLNNYLNNVPMAIFMGHEENSE